MKQKQDTIVLSEVQKKNLGYLDSFLVDLKVHGFSEGTIRMYHSIIKNMILLTDKEISDWIRTDRDNFLIKTEEKYKKKKGDNKTAYSVNTKMLKSYAIQSFMNFCEEEQIIQKSKLRGRSFRQEKAQSSFYLNRKLLDDEDLKRFINLMNEETKTSTISTILSLQFDKLLRIGEAISLKIKDINWDDESIIVFGKGKKYRLLEMDDFCFPLLYDYILEYHFKVNVKQIRDYFEHKKRGRPFILDADKLKLWEMIKNRDPAVFKLSEFNLEEIKDKNVFLNRNGKKFRDASYIHKKCREINNKYKFPKKITPHFFRGNGATRKSELGAPLEVVQDELGHSSPSTTRKYVENSRKKMKNFAKSTSLLITRE